MPDDVLDLLLSLPPLLNVLHGEKRAWLQRSFTAVALRYGTETMSTDEGRLPVDPREAALRLHRACLDLCMRLGISRVDLTEHFNDHGEAAGFQGGAVDDAAEQMLALLAIFHARRLLRGAQ